MESSQLDLTSSHAMPTGFRRPSFSIVFAFSWLLPLGLPAVACAQDRAPPLVESYLHQGRLPEGENACLLALDADPTNDEIRLGLGVIQFARAVENLGQSLHEYGAVSKNARQPFLRLPVPENENPSTISYRELGRVLDAFATDLMRAEATLAAITNDEVKLRLRLNKVAFDFSGTSENQTTLLDLMTTMNQGPLEFTKNNPEFRIHFDRGDVAWLRAYCHLLSAMVQGYRSVDEAAGFEDRVGRVFPKIEETGTEIPEGYVPFLEVVDAPRLRRMRLHLIAVCELNRETWQFIRRETDDDFEWLSHPGQVDQLGLPLTDERIDTWLEMMAQWEGLLKGERLLSRSLLNMVTSVKQEGGLNLKKVLDDPPVDLLNMERIAEDGIDPKYLEDEEGREVFDFRAIGAMINAFNGPFGFAYAARLN